MESSKEMQYKYRKYIRTEIMVKNENKIAQWNMTTKTTLGGNCEGLNCQVVLIAR